MHSKVQRWGNSLAVRIPKAFARDVGLAEDAPVEILVHGDNLVISRVKPRTYNLEQLLGGITEENIHAQVETGHAVGNEAW